LAARKRLEELTPMKVSYLAPPEIEEAPADSGPAAAPTSAADTTSETAAQLALDEQIVPTEQPVAKTRKRRAAATSEPIAIEAAETPANGTPAASAERTDETEPVTTEKAS
jgi:hypothetical protein